MVTDIGQEWGVIGEDNNDWHTDSAWSPEEYALLNFPDTISLAGTYLEDTTGWNIGPGIHEMPQNISVIYPNPNSGSGVLVFRILGFAKVKVVIVDKDYNRLFTYAGKVTNANILVDFSDSVKYLSGTTYRMFYTFSVTDSLNYYKGHGDILICRDVSYDACLQFVQK